LRTADAPVLQNVNVPQKTSVDFPIHPLPEDWIPDSPEPSAELGSDPKFLPLQTGRSDSLTSLLFVLVSM
jgi:hypothetical protein